VAGGENAGDVAGLPAAALLGGDAAAVQLAGDLLQLPARVAPGAHLVNGLLFVEVVHEVFPVGLGGQFGGGQRTDAKQRLAVGKGVEAIVAERDVAGELELAELVAQDGAGAVTDEVALILGDAGLDLKEQLVLRRAREGAAFGGEVRGDAQLPYFANGGDGVEGVPTQAVLLGGDEVLDAALLESG